VIDILVIKLIVLTYITSKIKKLNGKKHFNLWRIKMRALLN